MNLFLVIKKNLFLQRKWGNEVGNWASTVVLGKTKYEVKSVE